MPQFKKLSIRCRDVDSSQIEVIEKKKDQKEQTSDVGVVVTIGIKEGYFGNKEYISRTNH